MEKKTRIMEYGSVKRKKEKWWAIVTLDGKNVCKALPFEVWALTEARRISERYDWKPLKIIPCIIEFSLPSKPSKK